MFKKLSELFGTRASKDQAKNRLQMVLVQDRSGLSPADMDFFKKDLLEVIQRYFMLESECLEVDWERSNGTTALIINTPVMGRPKMKKQAAVS